MAEEGAFSQLMEGPEMGTQLVCSRNSGKTRVAGAEGTDGVGIVREVRTFS